MVSDLFGALLEELGSLLNVKLAPDANHSCLIKTKEGVSIQLELDRSGEHILFASQMPEVPSNGRFRETIFREALKANGMPPPLYGAFGYSKSRNSLILWAKLDVDKLNGEKLHAYFTQFLGKALLWYDALSRGNVPDATAVKSKQASGLFGLR